MPLTAHIPKCLVTIHDRPLLDYWLDLLFEGGIERALVNTHYLPEPVRAFIATSRWRSRIDLVHEPKLLGTGGTILANHEYFGSGPFFVAHADNLTRFNLNAMIAWHQRRPVSIEITMMTFDTDTPQSCGIVETDSRGVVVAFHEKISNPPGCRANGAVYILEPNVIAFLGGLSKSVIDLSTEVLPHFLGRMSTFHNADYHRDIGTLESLNQARRDFQVKTHLGQRPS